MNEFYNHVFNNQDKYVQRLSEYVAVASVSGSSEHVKETKLITVKCKEDLEQIIGATVTSIPNPEGGDNPPILFGYLGNDPTKKTLLVYGHLDVQPADGEWIIDDPFQMTIIGDTYEDKKMYGRGSTDDKGPVLAWINAINAYQELNMPIPVNIKFCFEAMEESGSVGLEQAIEENSDFFKNVDFVCISDNYWLGPTKPCVTYGLRGISYYNVTIQCANTDLHSGLYGGTVREALIDMVNLFSKLTDGGGKILIDGVNDTVKPLTEDEIKTYETIDFDPEDYGRQIGTTELLYSGQLSKVNTLTHRWRFPSLSIHGFFGDLASDVDATIIPKKVKGRFSIRLVPNQDPTDIDQKVVAYCKKVHAESGSKNPIKVDVTTSSPAWMNEPTDSNYQAGINAQKAVYGKMPDLTREGGSIPVTLTLKNATGASVMLLPLGQCNDGAHSQNEKMNLKNYIEGTKVLGTYLEELGKIA